MHDCKNITEIGPFALYVTERCPNMKLLKGFMVAPKISCEDCDAYKPGPPKCSTCDYCERSEVKKTGKYAYHCKHSDQKYIEWYFRRRHIKKAQELNFICYSVDGGLPMRTAPRWCPKKDEATMGGGAKCPEGKD